MSESVKRILEIMEMYQIEMVSYGLAPNPNGFCYELPHDHGMSLKMRTELDSLLDSLTGHEIIQLKGATLGF